MEGIGQMVNRGFDEFTKSHEIDPPGNWERLQDRMGARYEDLIAGRITRDEYQKHIRKLMTENLKAVIKLPPILSNTTTPPILSNTTTPMQAPTPTPILPSPILPSPIASETHTTPSPTHTTPSPTPSSSFKLPSYALPLALGGVGLAGAGLLYHSMRDKKEEKKTLPIA